MIKNIYSIQEDTTKAMADICEQMNQLDEQAVLTVLFVSTSYNLQEIECYLSKNSINGELIACTSSGEITPDGYKDNSMSAQVYYGKEFELNQFNILDLEQLSDADTLNQFEELQKKVSESESAIAGDAKSFGILLVDGLSVKEEILCGMLGTYLGSLPLIGGSAGDDLAFEKTFVYFDGKFIQNAATLTVLSTSVSFEIFKKQHFKPTDKKIVITDANPEQRVVNEINGEPAAEFYADLLGITIADFSPMIFSRYPLMLEIGGEYYVRSIQKVNEDGSLTFYCAIDNGLVLTLADKENLFNSDQALFSELKAKLGEIDSCLLFECILRRLEINELDDSEREKINSLYSHNSATGFYTYGEQFGSIHINQTLTGVAFGK